MLPTPASSPIRSNQTIQSRLIKDSDSFRSRAQELEILNILNWPEVMWSGTNAEIAKTCRCRTAAVENVRRRCVLEGFERVLDSKQRDTPLVPKLLDGKQEAEVIALRLGPPPESFSA